MGGIGGTHGQGGQGYTKNKGEWQIVFIYAKNKGSL